MSAVGSAKTVDTQLAAPFGGVKVGGFCCAVRSQGQWGSMELTCFVFGK